MNLNLTATVGFTKPKPITISIPRFRPLHLLQGITLIMMVLIMSGCDTSSSQSETKKPPSSEPTSYSDSDEIPTLSPETVRELRNPMFVFSVNEQGRLITFKAPGVGSRELKPGFSIDIRDGKIFQPLSSSYVFFEGSPHRAVVCPTQPIGGDYKCYEMVHPSQR